MNSVTVAFKLLKDGEEVPAAYKYIECHMIFDMKMENFRQKARLVTGGHMMGVPEVPTYASVVSRESVRITLTVAALNDLDILASNVQNAYITALNSERIWTRCGAEFGTHKGQKAIIV
jgi:hypothetical protein